MPSDNQPTDREREKAFAEACGIGPLKWNDDAQAWRYADDGLRFFDPLRDLNDAAEGLRRFCAPGERTWGLTTNEDGCVMCAIAEFQDNCTWEEIAAEFGDDGPHPECAAVVSAVLAAKGKGKP